MTVAWALFWMAMGMGLSAIIAGVVYLIDQRRKPKWDYEEVEGGDHEVES